MVEWKNINEYMDRTILNDGSKRSIIVEGVDIWKRPKQIEGRLLITIAKEDNLIYQGIHFIKYNITKKELSHRLPIEKDNLTDIENQMKDLLLYVKDMDIKKIYNNILRDMEML